MVGIPKLFCRNTVHLGSSGSLSLVWNSPLRLCCLATQEAPRVSLSSFFSQDLDHKPTSAWAWLLLLLLLFGCCSSCYCCCSVVVFLHRFWGLNPCPHACKASTLSTEPFFHPPFLGLFFFQRRNAFSPFSSHYFYDTSAPRNFVKHRWIFLNASIINVKKVSGMKAEILCFIKTQGVDVKIF